MSSPRAAASGMRRANTSAAEHRAADDAGRQLQGRLVVDDQPLARGRLAERRNRRGGRTGNRPVSTSNSSRSARLSRSEIPGSESGGASDLDAAVRASWQRHQPCQLPTSAGVCGRSPVGRVRISQACARSGGAVVAELEHRRVLQAAAPAAQRQQRELELLDGLRVVADKLHGTVAGGAQQLGSMVRVAEHEPSLRQRRDRSDATWREVALGWRGGVGERVQDIRALTRRGRTVTAGGVLHDDAGFIGGIAMIRKRASGGCRGLAAGMPHAHHRGGWSRAGAGSCLRRAAAPRAPCGCPAGRRRG